jgi:hypothetical protein
MKPQQIGVDLGDFGKRAILWGAGLSKNWGGFLADEFWGHLLSRPGIDAYRRLRELLLSEPSFERAIERVMDGAFRDEERHALWSGVKDVFEHQDERLLECLRKSGGPPVNTNRFVTFLDSFKPDRSTNSSGYLFTLNQDVLLEAMDSRNPLQAIPWCPGVTTSEGAFSSHFRHPGLTDAERTIHPVPGAVPQKGWPPLVGRLNYIKLHGSSTWRTEAGTPELVIGGDKTSLIGRSPLLSWYRDIFRAVCFDGSVRMVIVGYGFRDPHINHILAQGIVSHGLCLYVVGHESNSTFRKDVDHRLLSGLRGYTTTPLAEIIGDSPTDTVAMRSIKEFLQDL